MVIEYRDNLGAIIAQIDATYGVSFTGDFCYFTDEDGKDWKVPAQNVLYIGINPNT